MSKIVAFTVSACMLLVANAWGTAFMDDFNRPNGAVGNGWGTQLDGTIKAEIVDNEVLIAGTQATAWTRCGISRPVSNETRVSLDFLANNSFNFHVRIGAAASNAYIEVYAYPGGPMTYANSLDGGWPGWTTIAGSNMAAGVYNTLVLELEGTACTITLNGKVVGTVTNANFTSIASVFISGDAAAGTTGSLHIDNVQIGVVVAGVAKDPTPAPGVTDVPRDVVLGWAAGDYAATHNVFLGESLEQADSADVAQAVSSGQTQATFKPATMLEYGKTYYWRVDEVNAPPTGTVFKGDVWSFTVEPYTYPVTGVVATASSSAKDMGPEKAVNGSGLTGDRHSTLDTAMWLSLFSSSVTLPAWIRFELPQAHKLQQMWVWNSNQNSEGVIGYGAKDVTIEYSLDGVEWTPLRDQQFQRAPGDPEVPYEGQVIPLDGVYAKFVRLTIRSNWGGFFPQTGLSEVRFYQVPVKARAPQPAVNVTDVPIDAALDWRDGREAAAHDVYLSADQSAVLDGTAPVESTTQSTYQPAGLDFGQFYYWKVNEVNEAVSPSVWEGDLWSFSTIQFAPIDDFEAYVNKSPNRVFQTWIDGYGFSPDAFFPSGNPGNTSGSLVGYDPAVRDIMETTIVHGGRQSMLVEYDNSVAPHYSQIERTWQTPQDWTLHGATDLSMWVHGYPSPTSIAVTESAGKMTLTGAGADIWATSDEFTFAHKILNGNGTIIARVVGIGAGSNTWAKAGVMIRQSLNGGSTHAMMVMTANSDGTAGNGASFQRRMTTGGDSTSTHAVSLVAPPYWVKIERSGDTFSGSISPNGSTWTILNSVEIPMTGPVYIGLCVTSHAAGEERTFQFENISTSGNVSGAWQGTVVDSPMYNSPAAAYVTLQDSTGKSFTVTDPDTSKVATAGWTQWLFPLSDFTGVNAARITKMVVGIDNRDNPQAGGTGKLFFDDLGYGHPILPVGLVAHYELEDNMEDSSGNNHHGVLAGNAAFPVAYVDGPPGLGKAMLFDGTQGHQYVSLGTFNPSARTGQLTVALWARWDGLSAAWQGLIGKRNDTWNRANMMWQIEASQTDGSLRFQREGADVVLRSTAPEIGQWVHIAVTFDGTTATGYIDGVRTVQRAFSFGTGLQAPLQFGADTLGGGNSYNGALDDIRIYDIVLTDAEMRALAGK